MNIYEKIQKIKLQFKKSGKNKFVGFDYYELSDIMPDIIRLCEKYKVCTVVYFDPEQAGINVCDCENLELEPVRVYCSIVPFYISVKYIFGTAAAPILLLLMHSLHSVYPACCNDL